MKGWSKKRLVEITEKIGSGATPRGGQEAYKESGISLFRSLNVYDGIFKKKNLAFIDEDQASKLSNVVVREGDVLLNITGASVARCCVAPSEFLPARVNQHVAIIRPKLDYIDSNFLAYLLASKQYKDALLNTGEKAGSTRQALTKVQLENFEITIPRLPEQNRIVAILDEAFEGIDRAIANTKKNLTNARELFESYLNAIFTQKDDGWVEKRLTQIGGKVLTGPFGSLLHKSDYISHGIPLVNPANIEGNQIVPDFNKTVDQDVLSRLQAYTLRENDIIVGRRGEIGRCAVVQKEQSGWLCGTGCFFIQPSEYINSVFLAHLLRSTTYRSKLEALSTGATMKNLSNQSLSNLVIALPKLDKQNQIINKLDNLSIETQRLEAIYQQKLAALNELKQTILQKAFTGELTADTANQATKTAEGAIAA